MKGNQQIAGHISFESIAEVHWRFWALWILDDKFSVSLTLMISTRQFIMHHARSPGINLIKHLLETCSIQWTFGNRENALRVLTNFLGKFIERQTCLPCVGYTITSHLLVADMCLEPCHWNHKALSGGWKSISKVESTQRAKTPAAYGAYSPTMTL